MTALQKSTVAVGCAFTDDLNLPAFRAAENYVIVSGGANMPRVHASTTTRSRTTERIRFFRNMIIAFLKPYRTTLLIIRCAEKMSDITLKNNHKRMLKELQTKSSPKIHREWAFGLNLMRFLAFCRNRM